MKRKAAKKSCRGLIIVGVVVVLVVGAIFVFARKQREYNEQAVALLAQQYGETLDAARVEGALKPREEALYGELGALVKQPGVSLMAAVMAVAILHDAGQNTERRDEDLTAAQELRDLLAENAAVGARQLGGIVQRHPYLREMLEQIQKSPGEYAREEAK